MFFHMMQNIYSCSCTIKIRTPFCIGSTYLDIKIIHLTLSSSSIARPVPSRYMSTTVKGAAKVQKQLTVKLPNSLVKSILLFPPLPLPLIPSLLSLTYPFISSLVFTVFERLFSFIHLFVHSFIVFVLFIDSFLNSLTYTPFISH